MIKEKIEVSDEILAAGGFADVRRGTYHGHLVAVKTARMTTRANIQRIRKVSIDVGHPVHSLNYPAPAILQGSHPLEHVVPSKHLETCWSLQRVERATHYSIRVDGARDHHGLH